MRYCADGRAQSELHRHGLLLPTASMVRAEKFTGPDMTAFFLSSLRLHQGVSTADLEGRIATETSEDRVA